MTLRSFIEETTQDDTVLTLANPESPPPVRNLLVKTFENYSVAVTEETTTDLPQDTVAVVRDGDVVATSPLEELRQVVLFVNSDIYTTGGRELADLEVPDVLLALENTPFRLRGFPVSNTQKLLLITLSRYVEKVAYERGAGTVRAAFQRLSRLDDEQGTRDVYEQLASAGLDVHAYGVPDRVPTDLDVEFHGGRDCEYRKTWVVSYRPVDETARHAALVAHEQSPQVWDGYWTFDETEVRAVDDYMRSEL